jgi:hypothetical protein
MSEALPAPQQEVKKPPAGRKFERHSCRLKMRVRRSKGVACCASEERYTEGFVRNRSAGGYLLESPIYYPLDARLELGFSSPDGRESYLAVVRVKWTRRLGNAWYLGVSAERVDKF